MPGPTTEVGPYHGLHQDGEKGFAIVRHPVSFYRSWWAFRNNNDWALPKLNKPYFPALVGMTQHAKSSDFSKFVITITETKPKLYGSFLYLYEVPNVDFIKLEDTDMAVVHATPSKPELTPTDIRLIEESEKDMMLKYGYRCWNQPTHRTRTPRTK